MYRSHTRSLEYLEDHVRLLLWAHWLLAILGVLMHLFFFGRDNAGWLLLTVSGTLALSTAFFSFWYRRAFARGEPTTVRYEKVMRLAFWQIFFDFGVGLVAIQASGGYLSAVPLIFIVYFGILATFLPPKTLGVLNLWAVTGYLGLMVLYQQGVLEPIVPALIEHVTLDPVFLQLLISMYSGTMLVTGLLVSTYSDRLHRGWQETDEESDFHQKLQGLARVGLDLGDLPSLYRDLADQIDPILGTDDVFFTRWDNDAHRVFPAGASRQAHENYMVIPPNPRHERTFTRSLLMAGKMLIAEDVRCSPYVAISVVENYETRSLVAAPLYGVPDRRFLGGMLLAYNNQRQFSQKYLERARQVTDMVALLISRARLYEETLRRASLLERMAGQITDLTSDLQRTTLLPSIVESARALLHAERAALFLQAEAKSAFECAYSTGLSEQYVRHFAENFEVWPGAQSLHGQQYTLLPDVERDQRTSPVSNIIAREKFRAYAVFALSFGESGRGLLSLHWDEPRAFSADEVSVARLFAERAGVMLKNASLMERISEESLTDVLTGLPNRRSLDQHIELELERSRRYKKSFILLMMDLNGFKAINDTFGHLIGDSVLRQVAEALRKVVRASDFLARYGGDEFAVILPESSMETSLPVAQKLRMALATTKLHLPNETQRYLSAGVGISAFPNDAHDAESLIRVADQRLYRAKRGGEPITYRD